MAANFWASSHCKQLLDQEDVDVVHPLDKEKGLTLEEFKLIKIHMSNHISKFGERVKVQQRKTPVSFSSISHLFTLRTRGIS
ncbi:unnamed protein product [Victoria cruziana]